MPPASRTAVQDAISSLIKFESHFSNGEIPVYSHSVWKELAKEHKGAWSAHNWYNNVKKNLRGIWTKASEHWNFDCAKSDQLGDTLNSTLGQFEASFKIVLRDDRDGDSWFECFLSLIEWTRLFEPLRMDNLEGKVKFMLPPGQWGNDLDTIFWRQNRLPCSYLLEGAEVDTCSSSFLRMSGNCRNKHCQSEFYAYANIKPTAVNDELLIRVRTRDTRGIEHEKVQPHLDETRKRTVPKPKHNKPAGKQTRRVTTSCSDSSSLLKKEPGNEDLVTRVFHMQFSYPFMGSIHDVSYDPYYTFYALPSQLFVYKRHHASTRSSAISIGVLNKCAQELHRPEGLQSYSISMYTIVIKFEGELFPVYQMLCENKRMETREFGMKRWLRRVQSKPKLAGVVDYQSQHFIAYCRRLTGHWELYNNLRPKISTCLATTEITPQCAIYILQTFE
ncbi:uncharacterized protein LOC107041514 isoform X2 [Diachasma alloeum]|uniref:uncharacterized protein LOC107041514 isoform X2 n=1 Tax=Diachasma alloeum TaxID=454923 RepID=UPI00073827AD|nr:uncharacterized protein LOC107041514 isoform X2 [Diachasma alloeum]